MATLTTRVEGPETSASGTQPRQCTTAGEGLPGHLLPMGETPWAIWSLTGLRGAGFPADRLLRLAMPGCAAAADALLNAEKALQATTDAFRAVLNHELDALRQAGQWDDRSRRGQLLDALRDLKINRISKPPSDFPETAKAFFDYDAARKRAGLLRSVYARSYEDGTMELSQVIHQIASDERFQEAVIWQNRQAWRTAIKLLMREGGTPAQRTSKRRQHEELVASYLQRYCVKNDTIGFFGPVGWARIVPESGPTRILPGSGLLASRSVYFEGWCIDKLAAAIAKEKSFRPWLIPRRAPFIYLENGRMHLPGGASLNLRPDEALVLGACDGRKPARLLAAELLQASELPNLDENGIYRILELFCSRGLLIWSMDIPLQRRAEMALRELLLKITDPAIREPALNALETLEKARDRIAAAAGDVEKLDREMYALEEQFSRLTGEASTRAAGQTYAARTLVYEDCRRNIEVDLGPEILGALTPPLSLLLTSVRWMTSTLASMYREAFRSIYDGLVSKSRSKTINAADFWIKCEPIFYKDGTRIADRIVPMFQAKWMEVLSLPPEARRVTFTTEDLRARVHAAFPATCPSWSSARYNSPDVMIAAHGAEALRRGEFHLVIGEVHLGVNCLNGALFVGQHPCPQEIYDAITADFRQPRIVPVPPKNWTTLTARTSFEFISPLNYRLLVSSDTGSITSPRTLMISDLVVEERNGQLMLRTRDKTLEVEIAEGFGEFLSNLIMNYFAILPPLRHSPRITVDRVTITRESWRFSPEQLTFAFEADEAERFLGARRWMQQFDLPRFIFIKSPAEKKPFYVDFQSPVLINLFARMIRRAKETHSTSLITVTEMLPAHGECWLPDMQGEHYTSELRMVTLDMMEA